MRKLDIKRLSGGGEPGRLPLLLKAFEPGFALSALTVLAFQPLTGCSMSEEVRRIEEVRKAERRKEEERSANLTGEQIFVRSCNTCHPSAKAGMGPALDRLNEHFPEDRSLKELLRAGRGIMPGQPVDVINEKEMDNLVAYLRDIQPGK